MKRTELIKLLELVQPALSETDLVPVFTHFMFYDGAVAASNDALSIVAQSEAIETDGATFAVNGKTLLGLLKNSGSDDVVFADEGPHECTLKTGRSVFKLPYLTEDEFLFKEPAKEKGALRVEIDAALLKGIEICLTTASTDNAAPAIMGVCFNFGKPLTLYSCDGDAITRFTTSTESKSTSTFMVPTPFCDALLKICKETEANSGTLDISTTWAKAVVGDFVIYGRLNENKAPLDHAEQIASTLTGKFQFMPIPEGLKGALARAAVVAEPESKPTLFTVRGKDLLVVTETSMGIVNDDLIVAKHEPVEALVHASLVQRSIGICDQMVIRTNCTAYKLGDSVLQVVANIGE